MVQPVDLNLKNFERQQQQKGLWLGIVAGFMSLIASLCYIIIEPTTLLIPILILTVTLLPLVLWRFPRFALYLILSGVCLFEIQPTVKDNLGITDAVPFFWNINSMFERFTGTNPKAAPINFFELVLILFAVVVLIRFALKETYQKVHFGPLMVPLAVYLCFVTFGWVNGMATGGNFNEALQEVRAQFYFGIAYFLAVNAVRDGRHINILFWMTPILIGIKAINYIYRWYSVYHKEIPDQGVGSHEEAFFFISFVVLLSVLSISGLQPKLRALMWTLLPLVLFANATTNRRTAYAALIVSIPLLLLAGYKGFPRARRGILSLFITMLVLVPPYFFAFRNSSGAFAGPARAIQSTIAPDKRDDSSNQYRNAENYDLLFTLRSSSTTMALGYGYGKRFLTPVSLSQIKDIYPWFNLLPHNQILWVWMRLGTLGFIAFWSLVASIIVYACRIIRRTNLDTHTRATALYVMAMTPILLLFALYDLQLSNFRDMIFVAIWIGAMVGMYSKGFSLNDSEQRPKRSWIRSQSSRRGGRP